MKKVSGNPGGGRSNAHRVSRLIVLSSGLLLAGTFQPAKAGFVGVYGPDKFTLLNSGGVAPNGTASFPDAGTLILTGSNDGNGLIGGTTDLTIVAAGNGLFQFDYFYSSLDAPTFDYAGYILGVTFYQLAD